MKHGYFMLPLEPARGVRNARALCKLMVKPRELAWPGESKITCLICTERATAIQHSYVDILNKVPEGSEGATQAKRMLARLGEVLGIDQKTNWVLRYTENWCLRNYFIKERGDGGFWTYGLTKDDEAQDLYLTAGDARAAAQAFIDQLVEEEHD